MMIRKFLFALLLYLSYVSDKGQDVSKNMNLRKKIQQATYEAVEKIHTNA